MAIINQQQQIPRNPRFVVASTWLNQQLPIVLAGSITQWIGFKGKTLQEIPMIRMGKSMLSGWDFPFEPIHENHQLPIFAHHVPLVLLAFIIVLLVLPIH